MTPKYIFSKADMSSGYTEQLLPEETMRQT